MKILIVGKGKDKGSHNLNDNFKDFLRVWDNKIWTDWKIRCGSIILSVFLDDLFLKLMFLE